MIKQWSVSLVVQNAIRKIEKVLHVLAFSLESNTTTIDAIIIGPAWNVDTFGSKTKVRYRLLIARTTIRFLPDQSKAQLMQMVGLHKFAELCICVGLRL